MADWPGIDLRNRTMLHSPWSSVTRYGKVGRDKINLFPRSGSAVVNILGAFEKAGGSGAELIDLLNQHFPLSSKQLSRQELNNPGNFYSLEFYFYLVFFTKILLKDISFCYKIDEKTQLDIHHIIFEKGPLEFPPWVIDEGRHIDGYLSITNLASTFHYIEEEFSLLNSRGDSSALGLHFSNEALKYLNACVSENYRVERSFFEKEGILVSFEYISYAVGIFSALTNNENFIGHAHYYGHLHNNQLARAVFLQPSFSPLEGFREWLSRTNDVYKMEFRSGFRTLWVKINLRTPIKTGMFGLYQSNSIKEIKQAVSASHRAFLELATQKKARTMLFPIKNRPYAFWVRIRWHAPHSSVLTPFLAVVSGLLVLFALFYGLHRLPALWDTVLIASSLALLTGAAAAVSLNWRNKLKATRQRFSDTKVVIDKQLSSLKETTNEIIRERDSLESKVAERTAELNKALEQLKAFDRSKTNFIANVSHELRTPLTLLSVPLEGIKNGRYGKTLEPGHQVFDLLERNVSRLKTQINQLLDFTRLDLDTMPFEPRQIDLVSYCRGIVAELESLADKKGLYLKVENKTELDKLVISADQTLLETVILNLLSNALKFTDSGGVRIIFSNNLGRDGLIMAVEDSGIGFPPEEKDKLFQRFAQGDEHKQRRHEGTGLGLALVKEITDRHAWILDAESIPGKGASFFISMPLIPENLIEKPDKPDPVFQNTRRAERVESGIYFPVNRTSEGCCSEDESILLIEDNPDMGTILKDLLCSEYNIRWCLNGFEALEYLKTSPLVSLILCDVMMPGMSGFTFREKLIDNSQYNKIPFVFLTALADPQDKNRGLECGAVDYIQKPFEAAELLLKIKNLIDSNRASYFQAVRDQKGMQRLNQLFNIDNKESHKINWGLYGITKAEQRIVELVRKGLQDKEIASELSISPRTVSSHLGHIYQKTDTQNRIELINLVYK